MTPHTGPPSRAVSCLSPGCLDSSTGSQMTPGRTVLWLPRTVSSAFSGMRCSRTGSLTAFQGLGQLTVEQVPGGGAAGDKGRPVGTLLLPASPHLPPPPRLLPRSFWTVLPFQAPEMGTPLPQFPPNAPSLQGPASPPKIHLLSPSPLRGLLFPFSSLSAPPPQFL